MAGDRAEVHAVDDLDHILRNEPERVSNPKKYKRQLDKPVDPGVVELVTDWLGRLAHT